MISKCFKSKARFEFYQQLLLKRKESDGRVAEKARFKNFSHFHIFQTFENVENDFGISLKKSFW